MDAAAAAPATSVGQVAANSQSSPVEQDTEPDDLFTQVFPCRAQMEGMSLVDMKGMCKMRGLAQGGTKAQLLDRLLLASGASPAKPAKGADRAGGSGVARATGGAAVKDVGPPSEVEIDVGMHEAPAVGLMLVREDFDDMRTVGLVKLCAKRSLPMSGTRQELMDRLLPRCNLPTGASGEPQHYKVASQHMGSKKNDGLPSHRGIRAVSSGAAQQAESDQSVVGGLSCTVLSGTEQPVAPTLPNVQLQQKDASMSDELGRRTNPELKGLCKAAGLTVNGSKADLVKRLVEYQSQATDASNERPMLPGTPPDQSSLSERRVRRRQSSKGPDSAPALSPDPADRSDVDASSSCASTGRKRHSSKGPENSLLLSPDPRLPVSMYAAGHASSPTCPSQTRRRSKGPSAAMPATPNSSSEGDKEPCRSADRAVSREFAMREVVMDPSELTGSTPKDAATARCASSATSRGRRKQDDPCPADSSRPSEVNEEDAGFALKFTPKKTVSSTPTAARQSCAKQAAEKPVATPPATSKTPRGRNSSVAKATATSVSARKSRVSSRGTTPEASDCPGDRLASARKPCTNYGTTPDASSSNPAGALSPQPAPPNGVGSKASKRPRSSSAHQPVLAVPEPSPREASAGSKRQRAGSTSVLDLKSIIESSATSAQHQGWVAFASRRHGA